MRYAFVILCCLWAILACQSQPPKQVSIESADPSSDAYQRALAQAFADLNHRKAGRRPAVANSPEQILPLQLQKPQEFQVVVYTKHLKLNPKANASSIVVQKGADSDTFNIRIDKMGHCQSAMGMVPMDKLESCLELEIWPQNRRYKNGHFVRVFIDADFRAYGLIYHDYNPGNDEKKEIRRVQWDPSEPLSSELMTAFDEILPLDLPIHAANGSHSELGPIQLSTGPRAGQSCEGWMFRYKNTYGSKVKASWCEGDVWPAIVETNRYIAVLSGSKQ